MPIHSFEVKYHMFWFTHPPKKLKCDPMANPPARQIIQLLLIKLYVLRLIANEIVHSE